MEDLDSGAHAWKSPDPRIEPPVWTLVARLRAEGVPTLRWIRKPANKDDLGEYVPPGYDTKEIPVIKGRGIE